VSFWHRPPHAMTDAFTAAGFRIAFLCFLFFVLDAV
jgi:hypothetical protein